VLGMSYAHGDGVSLKSGGGEGARRRGLTNLEIGFIKGK